MALTEPQRRALIEAVGPRTHGVFGGGNVFAHPHVMQVLVAAGFATCPDRNWPRVGYLTPAGRVEGERLAKEKSDKMLKIRDGFLCRAVGHGVDKDPLAKQSSTRPKRRS